MKTFVRIYQELKFIDISTYPNDIDNYLHLNITDKAPLQSTPLLETYLLESKHHLSPKEEFKYPKES